MSTKPLRKSRTFLQKKSPGPSMEVVPNYPTNIVITPKNKSPSIEFPTSSHSIIGEELVHFSHPQHPLSHVNGGPVLFTCMGCKEYGADNRFTCQQCDFQLHEFCALAPPVLKAHPLHCQHQLVFNPKPVKGGRSKCDICWKPAKGYKFQCGACSFQMHPCCAMLSAEMNLFVHPHTLKLMTLASGDTSNISCAQCKRKRSGRVYSCTVCNHYYLHAVCAKDMVNGLHINGIKGQEKPSMFGSAARLASQAVVEFIGGLIEGIGEGVGEALIQNIARGRCISRRRS